MNEIPSQYYDRLIDKTLTEELKAFGAVLIVGPKWCGKTTTAKKFAKTIVELQDPEYKDNYLKMIDVNPYLILEGEKPLLIDEWQDAPVLWDTIRHDIDRKNGRGLYILTGSKQADKNKISHSGAGRISRLVMRTMSLFEQQKSNGAVSLGALFNNEPFKEVSSSLTVEDVASLIIKGGFPGAINDSIEINRRQINQYIDTVKSEEIVTPDGVKKDGDTMLAVMRALARNISSEIADTNLVKDIEVNNISIHRNTLSSYLTLLRELFIIEDLQAWNPKLRSKAILRRSAKRHFVDPSLAAALLDAWPKDLLRDMNTFGLLFESLVIRDLRIYSEYLSGHVYHYRDNTGLEVDAIIHLSNGSWAAFEVKLGNAELDKAAQNLLKLKANVAMSHEPSFLMIITVTKYAYRRSDGVYVVPLGCLKP